MITQEEANLLLTRAFAVVRACPAGRVTTYSWIAKALGYPRGARMLGWILNEATESIPAQRVINSKGELTGSWAFGRSGFGQPGVMHSLLANEGITFLDDGRVDLKRYGWDPSRDLNTEELQSLLLTSSAHPIFASEGLLRLLRNDPASPFRTPSSPEAS